MSVAQRFCQKKKTDNWFRIFLAPGGCWPRNDDPLINPKNTKSHFMIVQGGHKNSELIVWFFWQRLYFLTDKQFFLHEQMNYLVTVSTSLCWDLCQTGDRRWLIVLILIAASLENNTNWQQSRSKQLTISCHQFDKDLSTERSKLSQGNSFAQVKRTVCLLVIILSWRTMLWIDCTSLKKTHGAPNVLIQLNTIHGHCHLIHGGSFWKKKHRRSNTLRRNSSLNCISSSKQAIQPYKDSSRLAEMKIYSGVSCFFWEWSIKWQWPCMGSSMG